MAFGHFGEIGPDMIHRQHGGLRRLGGLEPRFGQHDEHVAGVHRGAHAGVHLSHQASAWRPHLVFHLHRLDDEQFVA